MTGGVISTGGLTKVFVHFLRRSLCWRSHTSSYIHQMVHPKNSLDMPTSYSLQTAVDFDPLRWEWESCSWLSSWKSEAEQRTWVHTNMPLCPSKTWRWLLNGYNLKDLQVSNHKHPSINTHDSVTASKWQTSWEHQNQTASKASHFTWCTLQLAWNGCWHAWLHTHNSYPSRFGMCLWSASATGGTG